MNPFRSLRGEKCGAKVGKPSRVRLRPGVERVENRCLAAVDSFIYFNHQSTNVAEFSGQNSTKPAFEIKDFSFGIEHSSTTGSATGGAGAGKAKFNEFSITKTIDRASAAFFANCVAGSHYKNVIIDVRNPGGGPKNAGKPFLEFQFNTVVVTKIQFSGPGDEGPQEWITFQYGGLHVRYQKQQTIKPVTGLLATGAVGSGQPVSVPVGTTCPPTTTPAVN
jgi:type VI protein secretion system component Hcp